MAKRASLVFELRAAGLTPHADYMLAFNWKVGEQSESGNIGAQAADAGGHIAFALNPTILVAVAQIKGPGELELSLVTPDGRPVGAAYTLELEVA